MSMEVTKQNFEQVLADREVRVIALSGKWGTGKSHMWKNLRSTSTNLEMKGALYVSLFGVASIAELKLKLGQAAIPMLEKKGPRTDAVRGAISSAKQVAQSMFRLGSALDELALLAAPALVRDKFIVIDDIERKHAKLTIDEVLGFIDDFTQNYGCRILLILNTDQLSDKTIWEKFREKVIDEELRLETTPAEAFDIAVELSPSQFAQNIKPAVETCGLTNIRIIRKVIRAANKILLGHSPLPADVLQRVIPSTVLLSAIHYKGIEDGPTVASVLDSQSSLLRHMSSRERERRGEEETEEEKLHAGWTLLLERLGIAYTDEYEELVSDYLQAGLVDRTALDTVIGRYRQEQERARAQAAARDFFQTTIWDPELTSQEIVELAKNLIPDLPFLDCYMVSSIHDYLSKFDDGEAVANQMISAWIENLHQLAAAPDTDPKSFVLDNWTGRYVHPAIVTAFKDVHGELVEPRSLLEVCLHIVNSNGWGTAEETVMKSATVDDFKHTILELRGENLKTFMLKNLDLFANSGTYSRHFGTGPMHFFEACKIIRAERAGTRWAALIEDLFKSVNRSEDLDG